jgi:hypothetical protein
MQTKCICNQLISNTLPNYRPIDIAAWWCNISFVYDSNMCAAESAILNPSMSTDTFLVEMLLKCAYMCFIVAYIASKYIDSPTYLAISSETCCTHIHRWSRDFPGPASMASEPGQVPAVYSVYMVYTVYTRSVNPHVDREWLTGQSELLALYHCKTRAYIFAF